MPDRARRILSIAATLCVAAAGTTAAGKTPPPIMSRAAPSTTTPVPPMFSAPEYAMGNPRAKVTVIEYASASCPHCARFDVNQFPGFKAKYVDTGKVRYIFREFLTQPEEFAAAGFLLARCSGQAHYWQVVEAVFHAQAEMYATNDVQAVFDRIAKSVGLTPPQVEACLGDKAAIAALNARISDAINKQHINETPSFLINGQLFKGDLHKETDVAQLSAVIDPLLVHPRAKARRRAA